jgi:predicted flap endonuclease-1-like 5' DNA nuclease
METLIYTILAILIIGVILYLLFSLKSKNRDNCHKVADTTHELHINYQKPNNKTQLSNNDTKKPNQLKEPRAEGKDNLQLIKGIGKVLEGVLNENGIYHFDQIANWTDENIEWMNSNVIFFPKKIEREDWRGQAKELAIANKKS